MNMISTNVNPNALFLEILKSLIDFSRRFHFIDLSLRFWAILSIYLTSRLVLVLSSLIGQTLSDCIFGKSQVLVLRLPLYASVNTLIRFSPSSSVA